MKSNKKRRLNVLLLDDEPQILNLNEQVLLDDFEVFKAENIDAATHILANQAIHIIVSDHHLGCENGFNFLRELHRPRPDIIKIIFSSCTHHEVILQSHNSEAVFKYLTKPCSNNDLRENVHLAAIAWEIKIYENQIKNEHSSFKQAFKDLDLMELQTTKKVNFIKQVTYKTAGSILYLAVAALCTGTVTLVLLYCLKSLMGFDIFK